MYSIFRTARGFFASIFIWTVLIFFLNNFSAFSQTETKNNLQRKIKILQETPHFVKDTTYTNLVYELGMQYAQYNLDSLLILSNESIKLSQLLNHPKGEIQGYLMEGLYYSNIGKQNRAILCFSKAISKAEHISDIDLLLESKIKLAAEYKYKEDYAKALQHYLDAIEIAKALHKNKWLSQCYVNISVIYSAQKEYDQSIEFLTKAMEINEKSGDDIQAGKTLCNLVACYIKTGNLTHASSIIDQAISVFEQVKLDSWRSYAYELKGTIFLKQNDFNKALLWLKKSEEIHKNIDKARYKIPLYTHIAKTYYGLKDFETAERYALQALQISKQLHIIEDRDNTLNVLYNIGKATDEPKKALTYLEELKDISDTLNKKNNLKELRILKSNLEFKQEKEKYISESQQKHNRQRSYIFISLLIILAFSFIIFILKRNNKSQNILNQKLIENTHALEKNEIGLNHANNTKNKLFSIIAHDLKGPINSFKGLFDLFNTSELSTSDFLVFMPQMSHNIDSIAFTLNNLLSWGQTQMNGLVTKPSFTNIKALVDENIALLAKQTEAKSIETIITINPHIMSWCDKNQIDIVIRNLISNAVKFTRAHGTITISATEQSDFWEIQIKDNGVGINENALIDIFNDSATIPSYGTMNEKGTGLGLRVCKEMVKNNGGHIWAESALNQGTSFYFTIPKTEIK